MCLTFLPCLCLYTRPRPHDDYDGVAVSVIIETKIYVPELRFCVRPARPPFLSSERPLSSHSAPVRATVLSKENETPLRVHFLVARLALVQQPEPEGRRRRPTKKEVGGARFRRDNRASSAIKLKIAARNVPFRSIRFV